MSSLVNVTGEHKQPSAGSSKWVFVLLNYCTSVCATRDYINKGHWGIIFSQLLFSWRSKAFQEEDIITSFTYKFHYCTPLTSWFSNSFSAPSAKYYPHGSFNNNLINLILWSHRLSSSNQKKYVIYKCVCTYIINRLYLYISMCVCVCVYIYIYIHTYMYREKDRQKEKEKDIMYFYSLYQPKFES